MIEILRDPGWSGVSGLIAIATILYYLMDRRSPSSTLWKNFFLKTMGDGAFALYGIFLAPLLMGALGPIPSLMNLLFGNDIPIPGTLGRRLLSLSGFKIWLWEFGPSLSILERQLGAAGLYFGGFGSIVYFGSLRIVHGITIDKLPNWYHFLVFFSMTIITFVGVINIISTAT